jgi:hypothetical protein
MCNLESCPPTVLGGDGQRQGRSASLKLTPLVHADSLLPQSSSRQWLVRERAGRLTDVNPAADLGNAPLSITEIPQLIGGVGCR